MKKFFLLSLFALLCGFGFAQNNTPQTSTPRPKAPAKPAEGHTADSILCITEAFAEEPCNEKVEKKEALASL